MLNLMTAWDALQWAFFSTVTRLSTDPPHMLDLQNNDPTPTHHHHPYLSWDLHPCALRADEEIQLRSHTTQQSLLLRMIALCTHLRRFFYFFFKCGTLAGTFAMWLNLQYALLQSNKNSSGWVKLCLYWHTVRFQLSLMKQHGYKVYSHKGTIIFIHFALWYIVYCCSLRSMSIGEMPLQSK